MGASTSEELGVLPATQPHCKALLRGDAEFEREFGTRVAPGFLAFVIDYTA